MKLHTIAVACVLAAAGSAQALTPAAIDTARTAGTLKEIYISGASALRVSFGAYVQEICNTGDFDVMYDDGGTGANLGDGVYRPTEDGVNYRAYSCTLKAQQGNYAAGTPVLVHKRDLGGSGQGVTPILVPAQTTHMTVAAANCVANAAQPSPAVDIQIPSFLCTGTTAAYPDGGISDVEPTLLQANVNLQTGQVAATVPATVNSGSLVQALFGIVVNKKTYRALQEAQGIIAPGAALLDVPADQNAWTAADIATIPSLPLEFVRAAHTGNVVGAAGALRGWETVIPASVDANVLGKTMNICRRVEGSGTQAASNVHLMLNPCQSGYGAALTPSGFPQAATAPAAAGVNGTIGVKVSSAAYSENTSAGNVETCIGTTVESAADADGIAYGMAWLGRELNPKVNGGDRGYRWVKLDGQVPMRDFAKRGLYNAVFESTMQWNTASPALTGADGADRIAFLTALRGGVGKSASLAKLDADTQQAVMAPPATYTGAWEALTNADEVAFASRVSRANNNSCTPLRITK